MDKTRLAILTAVFLCVLSTAIPLEASTWTIPGIANISGANSTHFVSDLAVTNPTNVPAIATLTFLPAGLSAIDVTLGAGQTIVYRNVLGQLWGVSLGGAVQVSSDSVLLLRARTYNDASSGTYGVALPVFADDRLLLLGDTAHSLWVSQSAAYRTNIAVVFPDDGGGAATVTIFDADGKEVGSRDFSLDAAGFQQFGVSSFSGAVPVGRAEIIVTRGRAAGYSVVVDNVTGDSSLFTFEDLPAGYQDVLVNGVARANGKNGTFFRTDARFYNPNSEDATVTVAFHANQGSNPSPLGGTFIVPAGKIRDVVDVLDSLLGLPAGSSGALRFSSAIPVAILCRTSNVDPTGTKPGTYGAQQKPTQLLSFLTSADGGGVVTGIRQNVTFRTNIGFAAGEDGADYLLTLRNTSGATVATSAGSLGAFGFTQPNVQGLFPGTTVPDDATLLVKVTSGSVDVYDSSNDNASGDPVVTPIMRVPIDLSSSATIGPEGGSIRSSDGVLTLMIPAGALSAPVTIGLAQSPNNAPGGVGSGYDISPGGLAFAKPALLSLRYGPGGLDVPGVGGIAVAFPTGTTWVGFTGGRIDTTARTLTIGLSNTSPSAASLPAAGRVTNGTGAPHYDFLQGLEIGTAPGMSWVPTDGTRTVQVFFRLPPSGTGQKPESFILSSLTVDPSNVTFFPPKIGSISRTFVDKAVYTAPHSIAHASVPVRIRVKVLVTRGTGVPFGYYEQAGDLYVVRRKWNLKVEFKLNIQCVAGSGNEDYSYKYADDQNRNFRIGDDLSVTADPFLGSLPADADLKNCRCTATMMSAPGTLAFTGVSGSLVPGNPARFDLIGKAEIVDMIPPIQWTCPSPLGPVTDIAEPATFDFYLFLGLLGVGGIHPDDGIAKFIIDQPPLLTIVVEWHSVAE